MGKPVITSIFENTRRHYSKKALESLTESEQRMIKDAELQRVFHLTNPSVADDSDLERVYQEARLAKGEVSAKFLSDELTKNLKTMISEHQTPDRPLLF